MKKQKLILIFLVLASFTMIALGCSGDSEDNDKDVSEDSGTDIRSNDTTPRTAVGLPYSK